MRWVDSHCHLQLDGRDPDELLGRAPAVDWLVVPGIDADSSEEAFALADRHPSRVTWTAGLHPHDADRWSLERARIEALVPKAAAVGETGLDYYRNLSPPDAQRAAFLDHIALAREHGKPLVVHCRDAFADIYELIDSQAVGARTVLHCWTGGPKWTRRFLDLGVTFSFAGPVAFESGETVRLGADLVPPERALVETDTPYLAPPPHRAEQNEPAWVELVGSALAGVWGIPVEEVASLTSRRAREVFGAPPSHRDTETG